MAEKTKTLFEKIWEDHVVREKQHEPSLLYIDLHLVHEVTSPQAFEGLRAAGRTVRPGTCPPSAPIPSVSTATPSLEVTHA